MNLIDNVTYYDEFAAGYERRRHHGYHLFLDDQQAALVKSYLRPGARVLEIGCGTGLLMSRLADHEGEVVGVDLSPGMLEHARTRGLSVHEASATDLPFEDGSFDLAYSFKVLAHIRDIGDALAECARVLAPGGTAILEFYNPTSLRGLRKVLVRDRISGQLREDQVFTRFDSLGEARRLVEEAGMRPIGRRGIIVLTPFAQVHSVPLVGGILRAAERAASALPLGRFGGFLSVVAKRDEIVAREIVGREDEIVARNDENGG